MTLSRQQAEAIAEDQRRVNREALLKSADELGPEITRALRERRQSLDAMPTAQADERRGERAPQLSQPVPLVRPVPQPAEYPTDALGPILAPAAEAISNFVQVPAALAGNSVLAASALSAQAHANVQTLGGVRPLSLYVLTIAESGERKTTADNVALTPIRERAEALSIGYRDVLREFEAKSEAHKMRVRQAKERNSTDADALTKELQSLSEDTPPRKPFMLVSEPTAEGLMFSLKDGQLSQGLFTDEGGSFIGGHALSDEAELRTIAMLSRAWDGAPLDRVRAKDREHVTLYGRRLSLHLMAQPDVALRLLGKALYRSQGFLARFLIASPQSLIGSRKHNRHALDPQHDPCVRQYWLALRALLERVPTENQDLGGLSPPCIVLSAEARALLVSAYNEIESAQGQDGELSSVREFASKASEHACRIAATLALVSKPDATTIEAQDMKNALELVQFYLGEHVRLAGSACLSLEIQNGQKLLDWFVRKGLSEVTSRYVMQFGPNAIREAPAAKAALKLLAEHGWLITQDGSKYTMPAVARSCLKEGACSA